MTFKLDNRTLILGLVIVLLVGAVIYLYTTRGSATSHEGYPAGPASQGSPRPPSGPAPQAGPAVATPPPSPMLVLFFAKWCHNCTQMKGEWEKAVQELAGSPISVVEIEDTNPEIRNHQIAGFPTVRFYPLGLGQPQNFVEFKNRPRVAAEFAKFALSGGRA